MRDVKLDSAQRIHGAQRVARPADVNFDDAAEAFGLKHDDFNVPLPDTIKARLDDVHGEPKGTMSRLKAETRAFELDRKLPRGVSIFAQQVRGHWCVVKATNGRREVLEG